MKTLFIIILLSILFIIIINHKNIDSFESNNLDWNTFYSTLKKDITNDVLEQIKSEIRSGNFQVNTSSNYSLSEPVTKFLTYLFTSNNPIQTGIQPNQNTSQQQTSIQPNQNTSQQQTSIQPNQNTSQQQTDIQTNPNQQQTGIQSNPSQQQTGIQTNPSQQQTGIQTNPSQQQTDIQPNPNTNQQQTQNISIKDIKCPKEDVWFETTAGQVSNLVPCGDNFVGEKFRRCGLDGVWSEVILTNCYPSSTVRA
jgi:hypothetical protein